MSAGPGFGNKTSKNRDLDTSGTRFDRAADTLPYSGGTDLGSGTTGGVGFGNKTSGPVGDDYDGSNLRFGSNTDTAPYRDCTDYGSGTTEGEVEPVP